ncbi:YitT family protein [Herbaspirillum sp. LeCh32-8]|uniref:YitT family protein n=1 Tax=Herbaspirillum sp. LeCh32-8 TaxID=2821356 RepID=UPI001AE1F487|nr:YitT family protein [Herbaspirillum sp. LeCh32-8]
MAEALLKVQPDVRHRVYEDALALVAGTLFISLGVNMYTHVGLLTGSTAGLAFLIHYLSGLPFGVVFFVINIPFYYFAFRRMGMRFMGKTFCAVALVSGFSLLHPHFIAYDKLDLFYSAVLGGLLIGSGFVMLFRHGASLGGVNVVTLFLQDRYGLRAGKLQMGVDVVIVLASLFVVTPTVLAASILGAVVANLVIALNHRPGRYMGM